MPLPALAAGAARMAASGVAKKAASGAAKKAASGAVNKTITPKLTGNIGGSPTTSPAALTNKKATSNTALLSESQQERALRMSRSETVNQETMSGDTQKFSSANEQIEDPVGARIRQQLEIRKAQQENEENSETLDEESQEEELSQSQESARASMASMASQAAGDLAGTIAKQAIKKGIWTVLASVVGAILSAISAVIAFLAPILLPILIIVFCFVLVYNYISEYKLAGGYQIMTGQFEELLNDAITNTPPDDSAATTQNQNSE